MLIPSVRAKSLPVPMGRTPRGVLVPIRPLATSPIVPSPPAAATRSAFTSELVAAWWAR